MAELSLSTTPCAEIEADALVIGAISTKGRATLAECEGLPAEARESAQTALTALKAAGKVDEVVTLAGVPGLSATLLLVAGLGEGEVSHETLRRAAGAAVRKVGAARTVAVCLPVADAVAAGAVAEGAALGAYTYTAYRSQDETPEGEEPQPTEVERIVVLAGEGLDAQDAVDRATALAEGMAWTRDLVNTPPNALNPQTFAEQVVERLAGTGLEVEVYEPERLLELGCGGIMGVGQGSATLPRIVRITWAPEGAQGSMAVIGKGITFDSGGLSIKPADGMMTMKCDMAGAAAVAGAALVIARRQVQTGFTGWLCLAENMTGSNAQRPGDIVRMRNGKTVEVLNTDAEGRLAMADGLCLASETQPDVILDIATLTGACVVALGERTYGVVATDDALCADVLGAAETAGESAWRMPVLEESRASLASPVADLKNIGARGGGLITAGVFLTEFVGEKDGQAIPFAHLDIAGPAFNDKEPRGHTPKGGTGAGMPTLVALAERRAG